MSIQGHVDLISREAVTGWAIDWDRPQAAIEILIIVDGVEVGRSRTDIERPGLKQALGGSASGFHEFVFKFDPPLRPSAHHTIEVIPERHGSALPNGRRTFFSISTRKSTFTPILVTSSGRSGSTLLMQALAGHPEIVVSNLYPFEMKLTSYYAAVWNVLTASCYLPTQAEIDFGKHSSEELLIGRNPWNRSDLLAATGGAAAVRLLQRSLPERLEHLLRSTVEDYYGILSDDRPTAARMFAEKSPIDEPVRQACRVLFDTVKEIVLVRDPRDYLCSAKSFWRTDVEALFTTMEIELPVLMSIHDAGQKDVLFVRYEDLILDATNTYRRIFGFLECEADFVPSAVAADRVPDSHRTSRSATESVGRFRRELNDRTIARCETTFSRFIDRFGY